MILELKIAVLRSKKSQMQIAQESGIDPSALSRIMNGWLAPNEGVIAKLSTSLGMSQKTLRNVFKKNNLEKKHGN